MATSSSYAFECSSAHSHVGIRLGQERGQRFSARAFAPRGRAMAGTVPSTRCPSKPPTALAPAARTTAPSESNRSKRGNRGRRAPVAQRRVSARPRGSRSPTRPASSSTTSRSHTSPRADTRTAAWAVGVVVAPAARRPARARAYRLPRWTTSRSTAAGASTSGSSARRRRSTASSRRGLRSRPRAVRDARATAARPRAARPSSGDRPCARSNPGRDDDVWLAVNNPAFAKHAEQGGWTASTLERRMAEAWFDPDAVLPRRSTSMASPASTGCKVHEPHASDAALGEIFVIGVDPRMQGTGLGRALAINGLDAVYDRGSRPARCSSRPTTTGAVHSTNALGFTDPPCRPRVRARGDSRMTTRYVATSTSSMLDSWLARRRRTALSRCNSSSKDSTRSAGRSTRSRTCPRTLRERLADGAPARVRRSSPSSTATAAHDEVAVARPRRRAGRDRAHGVPRARDGMRVVASRLRDGLHVLRHRTGRLRTPPHRGRDRSSRCCARSTRRPQRVSNVVFMGMGEPLANVDAVLDDCIAPARRRRDLGPAPHGVDGRRGARACERLAD